MSNNLQSREKDAMSLPYLRSMDIASSLSAGFSRTSPSIFHDLHAYEVHKIDVEYCQSGLQSRVQARVLKWSKR